MSTPGGGDRRVLVTGLGAICCLGVGPAAYWNGLLTGGGEPAEVPLPHLDMRATKMYLADRSWIPAEPSSHAGVELGSSPRMAVAAAEQALTDAGVGDGARAAVPVVLGAELGNADLHERMRDAGRTAWTPLTPAAAVVAAATGSRAAPISVGNACSASGYALTIALDMIRAGEADTVLAGGAEGVTRAGMGAFDRLGAADPVRCRPFDRNRAGTMFGDGAAMVVLEAAEHARRRGAAPYAELAGAAWSCDAYHPTAPDPSGDQVLRAMTGALADAGLGGADVGCVIPHGTGTPLNDVVESRALHRMFGARTRELPLFSLKAMIGHTTGAAGAFACLTAALMLRHRTVPANTPVDQDPECDVRLPQEGPVGLEMPAVLVNTYAFGGNNASLVVTGVSGGRAEGR
ncbi:MULTISPECIES: beta-ketoacyl-[acyl-carrier-protein] synthase family protein [Streptomyces]|uniref:beta-ketoacyl-[acyl-carrier-protein] synthase family protein n=1 Tax=Streptomyces TaxID=1883 RepID=UPI00163C010A|nr:MULTISPECIES: beta-ketoacyl-[acyl-carrier-protein] synthase family protein [Streptomyces]MBC2877572.1 beta-ketoacyl-[acyl-carrier-protein] synthase family protein [Streptomyces sp. TYQ1024]UBI36188.1 beta-ketoacyl-[acyl-carrier-protein] synthase family protein [Streptomyces mobaraensis]UKW28782.1 beta-ketoacyl-[acyl-carrier-protein] synthase family protein [Streptomyces sp. TYQ1024]